jgi:hypothetical protein
MTQPVSPTPLRFSKVHMLIKSGETPSKPNLRLFIRRPPQPIASTPLPWYLSKKPCQSDAPTPRTSKSFLFKQPTGTLSVGEKTLKPTGRLRLCGVAQPMPPRRLERRDEDRDQVFDLTPRKALSLDLPLPQRVPLPALRHSKNHMAQKKY